MFGTTLDYWLLRPLAHRRKMATEEELDRQAHEYREFELEKAKARLHKWNTRLSGQIPLDEHLRYLDVGCGEGDLTLAFALSGCKHVTGIDITPRAVRRAQGYAEQLKLDQRVQFACVDIHDFPVEQKYDVVLSHEMLEHVDRPLEFLLRLAELVDPGGALILAFGPLFHSPFGDHMNFFRVPIPWKGVLFSEQSIMRLRREFYRPTDPATCIQEIEGGLNKMRYTEFLHYVDESGWRIEVLIVNPQFRRIPPLYWLSNLLVRIPVVKDFFAASVYAICRRD